MRLRALAVACACLVAAPATVSAEWHITPMIGLEFAGKTTIADPAQGTGKRHPNFSGSVALLGEGILGAEGIVSFTPGFFQSGDEPPLFQPGEKPPVASSRVITVMGNVMVTVPRRWTEYFLRPYVSGGFGWMKVSKVEEVFPANLNLVGYNIGGGAIGFLTPRTGVRFDLRYFSTVTGTYHGPIALGDADVHVRYMTASVGVVIRR